MRKSFQFIFVLSLLFMWCANVLAQDAASMTGLAPTMIGIEKGQPQYSGDPTDANTGFGNDAIASGYPFLSMPIPAGTPFTVLNPNFTPGWMAGGDINAQGQYYGNTYGGAPGVSNLVQVNLATGQPISTVPITGISLYPVTLDYNAANGTWYYGETDGVVSNLYTLNIATGAATLIGSITNCGALIGLAIDCNGNAYGEDMNTDNLVAINLATAVGTPVGYMGFDCIYAQDADFDAATNTLYLASYDGASGASLRTCNTTTGGTTIVTTWPGSEITGFAIDNPCGPPCPIGAATNPYPANGATNVPITGVTATWTNGTGTVNVEVWFGPAANVVKVYDGPAITSYALPTLNYMTTYYWYIVCKDATCGTQGPGWSFTTMQNPLLWQWCDPFTNFNNWTVIGPLGMGNWIIGNTANAGGTAPELVMTWSPSFNGVSKIRSVVITGLPNNQVVDWSFDFFLDWYANPSGIVTLAMTYDGGATSTAFYTVSDPTGNVGPQQMSGQLTTPGSGSGNAQIEITYNGYSFNTDNVYWDNVCLEFVVPVELTSFAATADFGVVELRWITATETNNQGFEVQRSNGGEFETIAFVEGHGTTTESQAYLYEDRTVGVGSYSYRLKQIDFDGTFEYSNVIEADVPAPTVFALDQNYPNPFNPTTEIAFRLAADSRVSLKVFDVLGQEVATLVNTNLVAGAHKVNFNASSLNSGVYLYRIEANGIDGTNFVDVKKMILTK